LRDVSIEIQFLGAVGTVTGSQYLITAGERRILVDCGIFQGSPEEVSRNRMAFAFEAASVDALLLTHAHLVQCGLVQAHV
jgi:metallo-beta-lactamase family protein